MADFLGLSYLSTDRTVPDETRGERPALQVSRAVAGGQSQDRKVDAAVSVRDLPRVYPCQEAAPQGWVINRSLRCVPAARVRIAKQIEPLRQLDLIGEGTWEAVPFL